MTNAMNAGARLNIGERLVSSNGRYTLWMQPDGNLVLYHDQIVANNAYWATSTEGLPPAQRPVRLDMQADAHLVLYDRDSVPRWSSGTWGSGFVAPHLVLQDDGNLVIYHRQDKPVWASGVPGGPGIGARGYLTPGGPNPTLQTFQRTGLGANHYMETRARIDRNGNIDATTRTMTGTWLGGFTGGVSLLFADEDDVVIGSSGSHTFGVDGTIIGRSDRTDFWTENVASGIAERTARLVILHYWAPKWTAIENIVRKTGEIAQQLGPVLTALKAAGLI